MSVPIVAERKRWTKKIQKQRPGHVLHWAYGQLRDFGPKGEYYKPRDVEGVPELYNGKDRKSVSASALPQSRQPAVAAPKQAPPVADARPDVKPDRDGFLPIRQVSQLSLSELDFLTSCQITHGYYDSSRQDFVVRRGMSCFRGRGANASGWRPVN